MGQTPSELRQQAEEARHRLDQDLNRLEYQVRTAFDWRGWYYRRPGLVLAAAFGIATLISFTVSRLFAGARQ
jgi:hypothetical protein